MSDSVKPALEAVYTALHANNQGLDPAIAQLKAALDAAGEKSVKVDKSRLAQNDRQGRRMMLTYFKKRGVLVDFADA